MERLDLKWVVKILARECSIGYSQLVGCAVSGLVCLFVQFSNIEQ